MVVIKDKQLKYELIKRHVFHTGSEGKNSFTVYDEESADLAEKIIAEFPEDSALAQKLESLLFKWKLNNPKKVESKEPHWSESVLA